MESFRATVPFTTVHRAPVKATTFAGWASVFGTLIDAYVPTRILPGAFTKTLTENAKRIKVLYQHDPNEPIGKATVLREEDRGLYIEAQLSTTQRGLEVGQLLRDGVLTELSIGFDPLKYTMVNEGAVGQVRHISELRLWEVSLVTFAANREAVVTAVHTRRGLSVNQQIAAFEQRLAEYDERQAQRREEQIRQLEIGLLASHLGGYR